MDEQLPWHVRDHQFVTRFTDGSSHIVIHEVDDPDAPPSSAARLEHWETKRHRIGSGGQGEVFLQECRTASGPPRLRAVKMIPLQGSRRPRTELETIFRFSHPRVRSSRRHNISTHVCRYQLTDTFQYSRHFVKSLGWYVSRDGDRLCIAMEYLSQGDLQTYFDNNPPLHEEEGRQIASQVLRGLHIMHREGFSHRDVKPAVSQSV